MDAFNPKDRAEEVALYRSRIIGPLTVRELSRGDLTKEIEALSRQLFTSPRSHSPQRYATSTLERWYYKYKSEGLEGLKPKPRSDRGRAQQLSAEQKELLVNIRQEYPEASAPLIVRTLEHDGRLEAGSLSATTLRRFFREQGLDRVAVHNSHTRTRLRWQAERPGALWHADVCHAPALRDANDNPMDVRIHAILDDASRYLIAIEAMHQERALSMRLHGSAVEHEVLVETKADGAWRCTSVPLDRLETRRRRCCAHVGEQGERELVRRLACGTSSRVAG